MAKTKTTPASTMAARLAWERERGQEPGLFLPLRTVSETNVREHYHARAARAKRQRTVVELALRWKRMQIGPPWAVTLTRYGPRQLDDDNLASSFKATRDSIAAFAGVDDGDERWRWSYRQIRSRFYGVTIEVAW